MKFLLFYREKSKNMIAESCFSSSKYSETMFLPLANLTKISMVFHSKSWSAYSGGSQRGKSLGMAALSGLKKISCREVGKPLVIPTKVFFLFPHLNYVFFILNKFFRAQPIFAYPHAVTNNMRALKTTPEKMGRC